MGLEGVVGALAARGYKSQGALNLDSGEIVMVKKMKLDVNAIFQESLVHTECAQLNGVDFDGWGAAVVK